MSENERLPRREKDLNRHKNRNRYVYVCTLRVKGTPDKKIRLPFKGGVMSKYKANSWCQTWQKLAAFTVRL